MGAPFSNIIRREKWSLSPNAVAPKEETLKSDPTTDSSGAKENPSENPLESKFDHPKGALTSKEEAIAGDPETLNKGKRLPTTTHLEMQRQTPDKKKPA